MYGALTGILKSANFCSLESAFEHGRDLSKERMNDVRTKKA
jgi:hypothetical protein